MSDLITRAVDREATTIEPSLEAEAAWTAHVMEAAYGDNAAPEIDYNYGGNTPGKKVVFRGYASGVPTYAAECEKVRAADYSGFLFSTVRDAVTT